jgi:hypothetical protein
MLPARQWISRARRQTERKVGRQSTDSRSFCARAVMAIGVVLASGLAASLTGCQTATDRLESRLKVGEPVVKIFFAKYEDVEAALKLAMLKYPQRVDNTEAGIFETDFVKGDARFRPPHKTSDYSSGYRYRVLIRLVRGKSDKTTPAVKVVVLKATEQAHDFFADPGSVPSDGLEETVILYRIGRELAINKALQKASEKQQKKNEVANPAS